MKSSKKEERKTAADTAEVVETIINNIINNNIIININIINSSTININIISSTITIRTMELLHYSHRPTPTLMTTLPSMLNIIAKTDKTHMLLTVDMRIMLRGISITKLNSSSNSSNLEVLLLRLLQMPRLLLRLLLRLPRKLLLHLLRHPLLHPRATKIA